ncbi:hypothetical protein WS71_23550 [Burkholderia mayonis]|uniref:Uncharacterized protein n=2 Tax=Burkholderia mayonis TaxID=1385591 RepID=A0A1B4G2N9_9BURK|nr:hypothetical protein WS71_23550 [Burkholderia mayonis]KVE53815.1 hypothetical protein WS71_07205 [Burkholderia mayonis]
MLIDAVPLRQSSKSQSQEPIMKISNYAPNYNNYAPDYPKARAIDFKKLDWADQKTAEVEAGTILHHGNHSGTDGGAGQTGCVGAPIWLTSASDSKAAYGYSGGKYLLKYEATEKLKLAILDSFGNQVFPDEIDDWKDAREAFGLDGVLTDYGTSQEICLFDRDKIRHVETINL